MPNFKMLLLRRRGEIEIKSHAILRRGERSESLAWGNGQENESARCQ
jgi:hypothetical protein